MRALSETPDTVSTPKPLSTQNLPRHAGGGARPRATPAPATGGKEFMASLAKGLSVLGAFGEHRPTMSLTEAAAVTGLSRAAARRVLLTLAELGYVEQNGRDFTLAPRILELGFAYLSIRPWIERAEPLMKELSRECGAACSAAILQGSETVIVARTPASAWLMTMGVGVGTRLPAFHTALGRIQLGFVDEAELVRRLSAARIEAYTPNTVVDVSGLIERVKTDHLQGFSIVDEELEPGLRALAVPLVARSGEAVGAIDLSAHANRTTRNEMRDVFLPRLRQAAEKISRALV